MKSMFTDEDFRKARSGDPLLLQCLQCGRAYPLSKGQVQRNRNPKQKKSTGDFCSRSCANEHRDPPLQVTCAQCQKSFRKRPSQAARAPRNFCCHSCAAIYNNARKTTGTRVSKLEKWLQLQLPLLYPSLEFHFNRKDAINGELDIYVPALKLAFELNGIFHYEPIHGPEKLASIQSNDERKFQACIERGIEMCLVDTSKMKNFKEKRALEFLGIIQGVLDAKRVHPCGVEPLARRGL